MNNSEIRRQLSTALFLTWLVKVDVENEPKDALKVG